MKPLFVSSTLHSFDCKSSLKNKKLLENEKNLANIEATVNKYRITYSLLAVFCFLVITALTTIACSYIYDEEAESIIPREYETTSSFRYTGEDIIQEGVFKLVHGRHGAHGKLPDIGCATFYDRAKSISSRDNKEICLLDNERVQTLRFKPLELRIGKDVAVSTGPDSFITLYKEDRATHTLFNVIEKDLWSYDFDEMTITYIRDHIYSDDAQIMVEIDGPIAVPASCVLFSNQEIAEKHVSSFMICGRSGVDTVVLNTQAFAQIGVDMTKLGRDFPHITAGELTSIDLYTESNFKGPVLSLTGDQRLDISRKEFQALATAEAPMGSAVKWSASLSAMKISVVTRLS